MQSSRPESVVTSRAYCRPLLLLCLTLLWMTGCSATPVADDNAFAHKSPTDAEQASGEAIGLDPEISLALDRYLFDLYRRGRGVSKTNHPGLKELRQDALKLRKEGILQWRITAVRRADTPHLFLWVTFNEPVNAQHVLLYSERKRSVRRMHVNQK